MEKISVIIPVFNVEKYILNCLNSVINNSYKNLEIICINDGSTDNSLSILEKISAENPNIIVINKSNTGVSDTRNIGLAKATGKYIAFIDSDDYIHPQYFEILLNGIHNNNADMAICSYKQTHELIEQYKVYDTSEFEQMNFNHLKIPHLLRSFMWGRLIKKSVLNALEFDQNMRLFEDKTLAISLLCNNPKIKIVFTPLQLYFYYMREGSAMHQPQDVYLSSLRQMLENGNKYDNKLPFANEVFRYAVRIYHRELCNTVPSKELLKQTKMLLCDAYNQMCIFTLSEFNMIYRLIYAIVARYPGVYHVLSIFLGIFKKRK